ncbi:hypothetical protein HZA39_02025 [Candidatus Peregrinibacteria bacterium]|nr:hypothetical protein [Candidatus Peregrinibacteria bacterium]
MPTVGEIINEEVEGRVVDTGVVAKFVVLTLKNNNTIPNNNDGVSSLDELCEIKEEEVEAVRKIVRETVVTCGG